MLLTIEEILKQYGPFTLLTRGQADALCSEGKANHVFCVIEGESDEPETSEEDEPVIPPWYGCVGFHIVNVLERYQSAKPMPFELECDDVYFVDNELPAP